MKKSLKLMQIIEKGITSEYYSLQLVVPEKQQSRHLQPRFLILFLQG